MGFWGMGWIVGTTLLTLGVLAALGAVALALFGIGGGDEAWAASSVGAATATAIAALALVAAGAGLRWSGGCCGDDCCEWDDERPNATLKTGAP